MNWGEKVSACVMAVGMTFLFLLFAWVLVYGMVNGNVVVGPVEEVWIRWFAVSAFLAVLGLFGMVVSCVVGEWLR